MSGKPNSAQVEELRHALLIMNESSAAIANIESRIEALQKELGHASQRWRESNQQVYDLLHSMDCYGSGNAGWENRYLALLRLLAEKKI